MSSVRTTIDGCWPRDLRAVGASWTFVGTLAPDEMPAFFGAIDVLVVSSVNATESFGLVQVEAMLCGTPVVASDLPGVRQPVRSTGMGIVVPVADGSAIADAIEAIAKDASTSSGRAGRSRRCSTSRRPPMPTRSCSTRPGRHVDDHLTQQLATMAPHGAVLRAVECRLMGALDLEAPVLDLGCGDGHFASIAYDSPLDVGVDVREAELHEALDRGPSVYRHTGRGERHVAPVPRRSVRDRAQQLRHRAHADLDRVLGEIARVLRPGGTFATTLPSEHFADMLLGSTVMRKLSLDRATGTYGRWFNRISYHVHVYPPEMSPRNWRRSACRSSSSPTTSPRKRIARSTPATT